MINRLSLFFFVFLLCSCNSIEKDDVLASIFIFPSGECFTNYYIEIRENKTIECTKGLETENIRRDIYDNKKITPGVEKFISNDTWPTKIIDYETNTWKSYKKRHEVKVISNAYWERLKTCLSEMERNIHENIFSKTIDTDDWKWDNAGVVLMYRGNVYTFWQDSQQERERNLFRCLEAICPMRIVIPDMEIKPPSQVILVKKHSVR